MAGLPPSLAGGMTVLVHQGTWQSASDVVAVSYVP